MNYKGIVFKTKRFDEPLASLFVVIFMCAFLSTISCSQQSKGSGDIRPDDSDNVSLVETDQEDSTSSESADVEDEADDDKVDDSGSDEELGGEDGATDESTVPWLEQSKVDIDKLRRDAEKGDPKAQRQLGYCYETGNSVAMDWKEAFSWYEKSANQDDVEGTCAVGCCYLHGIGVVIDLKKAAEYLQKASDKGNAKATGALAVLLYEGYSPEKDVYIPKDEVDHERVLKLAQKAGEGTESAEALLILNSEALKNNDKDKSGECADKYNEILSQRVREGDVVATYQLSQIFTELPDFKQSGYSLLKYASDCGLAEAQDSLGLAYYLGNDLIEENPFIAVDYFRQATDQNYMPAFRRLGICLYEGEGCDQDPAAAVKLFKNGVDKGDGDAMYSLALCYKKGVSGGVERRDDQKAFELFDKAVRYGCLDAKYWKGLCLVNGVGCEKNTQNMDAGYWLIIEACDEGNQQSREFITNYFLQYIAQNDIQYCDVNLLGRVEKHVEKLESQGKTELVKFYRYLLENSWNNDPEAEAERFMEREMRDFKGEKAGAYGATTGLPL